MKFNDLLSFLLSSTASKITIGRGGSVCMAKLACSLIEQGRSVVLLAKNPEQRLELKALTQLFMPTLSQGDLNPSQAVWDQAFINMPSVLPGVHNKMDMSLRVSGLYALHNACAPVGLISCLDSFLLRNPPKTFFNSCNLLLEAGKDYSQESLVTQAVEWGFVRTPMVSQPGEFSVRGDILDIYSPGYLYPLRLEFFGDTVEQIRLFDPGTQRSVGMRDEVIILPAAPVVFESLQLDETQKYWEQLVKNKKINQEVYDRLEQELAKSAFLSNVHAGLFYPHSSLLTSYLPDNVIYLMPPLEECDVLLNQTVSKWQDNYKKELEAGGLAQPVDLILTNPETLLKEFEGSSQVYFEELPYTTDLKEVSDELGVSAEIDDDSAFDFMERPIRQFSDVFPLPSDRERPWHRLIERLKEWQAESKNVLLSFPSSRSRAKFINLSSQDNVIPATIYNPRQPGIYALVSPFRDGAYLPWANTYILGEDVIQPRKQSAQRVKSRVFAGLERYDDLKPGDYLVHRDYGIGRFEGLHSLSLGDITADFLLLVYADDDKFYLPVDRLSLVQRFKAPDSLVPPLDKLGGTSWQSNKSKIKKAIEQIAHDLVEMYAYRKLAKGYTYGPVNELFSEFEASFGFEETPDQARAIEDVLDDMDRPEAMDRLVCGDVGFGKTEVALRAAFRAAAAGKQVALLCPTTILAEQHYKTFSSRLSGFGLNVGMLSRFVGRKAQQEVIDKAGKGLIDVLIGTHRLLSGDVKLPNLSLLILDEEQRFGVRHKEKLKQMRQNIDVLTLTATPIPRTLQLSIAGIRGLSVIETAPPERKPVSSMVIQREDAVLSSVLARELERGGQAFWVHNRVQGIESVVSYVQKLAPSAKIGLAHGQMPERQLEDTMYKFWHNEIDILVCTAIIESGLDFPRANTLIVDSAHMFGLGQLYQLRGRVGRSDRQAYAVFVAPGESKTKNQQLGAFKERLRVILDMDYLGAGFQVAMEDLRIRGAGNILGEAQSGHMARVGLDLYLEMLEDAVSRLKGDKRLEIKETELAIGIPAFIPADYIADSGERLNYYKALSSAPDADVRQDVVLELRDRYGPMPQELTNFVAVLSLKHFLTRLQVAKADIFDSKLKLSWSGVSEAINPAVFVRWVGEQQGRAKVLPNNSMEYMLDENKLLPDRLLAVCDDLLPLQSVE